MSETNGTPVAYVEIHKATHTNYERVQQFGGVLESILLDFRTLAEAKYKVTVKEPDTNNQIVLEVRCRREKVLAELEGPLDQVIEGLDSL